jgi:hypothetical protein
LTSGDDSRALLHRVRIAGAGLSVRAKAARPASRARTLVAAATTVAISLALSAPVLGLPAVSRFSVSPSTTQAGSHPNVSVLLTFDPPSDDVRQIALHLPAGLNADARAAPFCSRSRLLADLCDLRTSCASGRARSSLTARATSTKYALVERSRFVPKATCETPVPAWKQREWARDPLPEKDRARSAAPDEVFEA